MKPSLAPGICAVVVTLSALTAVAGTTHEIRNWRAPATWTPPGSNAAGAGRTANIVTYPPLPFVPVTPCRLVDTRAGSGFPAGYGPPSMAGGGTQRTFVFTGQCGIDASAQAVSMNIAVWAPPTRADLRVFPAGGATPLVSTLNWEAGILALANAAVVPVGTAGGITVQIDGASTVDIFIDVNGFYGPTPQDQTQFFTLNTNSTGYTMLLRNLSTTCTGACGVFQSTGSGTALWGRSATNGDGVYGVSVDASGAGVHGFLSSDVPASAAVRGEHTNTGVFGIGVHGSHGGSGWGVYGVASSGYGVYGNSPSSYGVVGRTSSTANSYAGVLGFDGAGAPTPFALSSGVLGQGQNGVVGISNTTNGIGVYGIATSPATFGVFAGGNLGATGTKPFVEPHPTDATKEIRFVALEGNEAGTYFRGTAKTVDRKAVIQVPEEFRMVTAADGLTVQLTPVGVLAQIAIISRDLNQIVVQSSRDVAFDYHVHGVRRAFTDWQVVSENVDFRPVSADAKLPLSLPQESKNRLIANGTYNTDGTVNMRTAEHLGWAQKWRDEAAAQAKAAEEAKAKVQAAPQGAQPGAVSKP